jgi:hypothetical protein
MIGSQIGDQGGKTTEPFGGSALLLFAIIWTASGRRLDATLTDL